MGHKVVSIRPAVGSRHMVAFENGSTLETTLLVGGDGAWSRARPLMTDVRLIYTGISFVELNLAPTTRGRICPGADRLGHADGGGVRQGNLYASHADGSIPTYVAVSYPGL